VGCPDTRLSLCLLRPAPTPVLTGAPRQCRYAEFVADDYASYLRDMSRDGTWGDDLTLQVAASRV
jgi:hypothetical protein